MTREQRALLFTRVERATDAPMLVLALIFLVIVLVPEVWPLGAPARAMLSSLGWLIWSLFAVELAVKTYLAQDRRRYLITHWLDVLTVLVPFLRPLRLLRVAVVAVRLWDEIRTVLRRRTFSVIGVTSLGTVLLTSLAVFGAERGAEGPIDTLADALWWSVTTITTVGYGDTYPVTPIGRAVAVFLMVTGISLFGLLTARVAAFFVEEDERSTEETQLGAVLERLEVIEGQNQEMHRKLAQLVERSGPHERP